MKDCLKELTETDLAIIDAKLYYQSLYPSFKGHWQPVHAEHAHKLEKQRDSLLKLLEYVIEDLLDGTGDEIEAKHMRKRINDIMSPNS